MMKCVCVIRHAPSVRLQIARGSHDIKSAARPTLHSNVTSFYPWSQIGGLLASLSSVLNKLEILLAEH